MIAMAAEKLPYDAKHVVYRDDGTMIHAFWTSAPEAARQLADRNTPGDVIERLWFRDDVEIVATATRFYKRDGAGHSGWVVNSGPDDYSDSIPNKREAMKTLRHHVTENFKRGQR